MVNAPKVKSNVKNVTMEGQVHYAISQINRPTLITKKVKKIGKLKKVEWVDLDRQILQ
jgi:hypothetical protein